MKLIIEPDAGVGPLLAAIKTAKKSVEIAIFRFDRRDIEMALKAAAAAKRVGVTAVIAFANRGGEQNLRRLESRRLPWWHFESQAWRDGRPGDSASARWCR